MDKRGRPMEWYVGKMLGRSIELVELTKKSSGHKKFKLQCIKCGATSEKWVSQINSGSWEVCEHDLD